MSWVMNMPTLPKAWSSWVCSIVIAADTIRPAINIVGHSAFSAVSHRTTAGDKPALGTIKLEADTQVSVTERLVNFQ